MSVALGIDIGGTKIAAGLVIKDAATSPSVITSPTPATAGAGQIMASVFQLCERALGEVDAPVDVIGVGSAGTIDSAGRVIAATSLLRDWVGTEIAADLSEKFGVPAVAINDVHAGGFGQHSADPHLGTTLFVAVGTGIGGAIISGGEIVFGHGFTAGSLGHMIVDPSSDARCSCGHNGHVEALASGSGMEHIYRARHGQIDSLHDVAQAARSGDARALEVIASGGRALGIGLASAAALLNPDQIVVSGGLLDLGPIYWDSVSQAFTAHSLASNANTPIIPSVLGKDAILIGAARWALHRYER